MECQIEQNEMNCNCTYDHCPRRGKCCECIKYHKERRELPACLFSAAAEKTYDRSIRKFIEDNQ